MKNGWWHCFHCGCDEYEPHVFTGHMKGVPMIHCRDCGSLHSVPDPNSKPALRWRIARLEENIVELWHESEAARKELHEYLGMTWDEYREWANPASGTPTRRAETTGSVGEADGGPTGVAGDAQN